MRDILPVPAPCSTKEDPSKRSKAGGNNQKFTLFNLGNGASMSRRTNQFPNPPIKTSITKKKIIIYAWGVIITLQR